MMIVTYILLGLLGTGLFFVLGYLFGLRRFQHQLDGAVASAKGIARAEAEQEAAPDLTIHTVILDGISASGKTTFIARLAFPCAKREQLLDLQATPRQYLTHPLPLCFEWPPADPAGGAFMPGVSAAPLERIHSLRFFDVSGEKPSTVVNAVNHLSEDHTRTGRVTALWVWDMSNAEGNQKHINFGRVDACYANEKARLLIKEVVVFFNKLDSLDLPAAKLEEVVQAEQDYVTSLVRKVFDSSVPVHFHRGSALEGLGVFDAYGGLLRALGLAELFPLMPEAQARQVAVRP